MLDTTRLESVLRLHRPGVVASLQPGATDVELAEFERLCGVALHDDHRQLYRWHNGQSPKSQDALLNCAQFMPLAKAATHHRDITGLLRTGDFHPWDHWWNELWVPFLEGPTGDLVCVDYRGLFGGRPGQVVDFVSNDNARAVLAPDLASWFNSLCDLVEGGLDDYGCVAGAADFVWSTGIPGYPRAAEAKRQTI